VRKRGLAVGVLSGPGDFRGQFSSEKGLRDASGRASGAIALTPQAVAAPLNTADVSTLLQWAGQNGVSVIPRGAGTGMPGGNVGEGISLDLSRHLNAIGPVDRERRSVYVEPGAIAEEMDLRAHEAGLFFPALPASAARCTLGGMLANNAAGARSFGYGSVRDWVSTLDVMWADGSLERLSGASPCRLDRLDAELRQRATDRLSDWPAVRKNSSGYAWDHYLRSNDPTQLILGSEGTLGVIVGAELRLAPVPDSATLVALPVPAAVEIPRAIELAIHHQAAACEFFGRSFLEITRLCETNALGLDLSSADALLLLELDRDPDCVSAARDDLVALAKDWRVSVRFATDPLERQNLWSVRRAASPRVAEETQRSGRVSTQFIEDSVVPTTELPAYLSGLQDILDRAGIQAVMFGHAGDANVHVNPLIEVTRPGWKEEVRGILEETVDLVAGLGGTLAGEHGDGRLRAPYIERIWGKEWAAVFRETKKELDPDGILNPGVVVSLDGQDPLEGLTADRIR
jgi:FAD/FMN-containing dehydrogenase